MVLDTSEKWLDARKFYEKNGYKETGRKKFENLKYKAIFYEKGL